MNFSRFFISISVYKEYRIGENKGEVNSMIQFEGSFSGDHFKESFYDVNLGQVRIKKNDEATSKDNVNYAKDMILLLSQFYLGLVKDIEMMKSSLSSTEVNTKESLNVIGKADWTYQWFTTIGKKVFDLAYSRMALMDVKEDVYRRFKRSIDRLNERYHIVVNRETNSIFEQYADRLEWILNAPFLIKAQLVDYGFLDEDEQPFQDYVIQKGNKYQVKDLLYQEERRRDSLNGSHFFFDKIRRILNGQRLWEKLYTIY